MTTLAPTRPSTNFIIAEPAPSHPIAVIANTNLRQQLELIQRTNVWDTRVTRERFPQASLWRRFCQLFRAPHVITLSNAALAALDSVHSARMSALDAGAVAIGKQARDFLDRGRGLPILPRVRSKLEDVAALRAKASDRMCRIADALEVLQTPYKGHGLDRYAKAVAEIPRESWSELADVLTHALQPVDQVEGALYAQLYEARAHLLEPLPLPEHVIGEPAGDMSADGATRVAEDLAFALYIRMKEHDRWFARSMDAVESAMSPERTDLERAVLGGVAAFFKKRMTSQDFVSFALLDKLDLLQRIGGSQPPHAIARAKDLLATFERNGGRTFAASIERWSKKLDRTIPMLRREQERADADIAKRMRDWHRLTNTPMW